MIDISYKSMNPATREMGQNACVYHDRFLLIFALYLLFHRNYLLDGIERMIKGCFGRYNIEFL
jgi:hypothetical protein